MEITVITDIPSPYQVELFDAIAGKTGGLRVLYVRRDDPARWWSSQSLRHHSVFLDDLSEDGEREIVEREGLLVFSFYGHRRVDLMMRRRRNNGKPWCFWGERLGFRHSGPLGRFYRRWKLRTLHRAKVPIWGIGEWAIESYAKEFGDERPYFNVPYFSDLERFATAAQRKDGLQQNCRRVFLYSGSFSERKGVDLLAKVFARVLIDQPESELWLLGDGLLRSQLEEVLSGVTGQVRFLGFKDWGELPDIYAQADILCVPSRHDGWALVVPEGLASGLPVISTDRTGAALDLIEDRENGWIVEAGSETSLEQAVREAVSFDLSRLEEMKRAAVFRANRHNLEKGAERFLAAARESLASGKRQ